MWMIAAIGSGGAVGAVLRHLTGKGVMMLWQGGFPLATLLVNILGSFVMGLMVGIFAHIWDPSPEMRAFLTVGVLGGYTTFSSFSLDVLTLMEKGEIFPAMLYVMASVLISLIAIFGGLALVRSFA